MKLAYPCCSLCQTVRSALQMEDVVRDAHTAAMTHILVSRSFGYLTHAQRGTVIDALMLTFVPPGGVPDAHREALRRKLLLLPWAWELSPGTEDGLVDRSGARLVRIEDPRLLRQFARRIGRDLRSAELHGNVLRLMILLCEADGGNAAHCKPFLTNMR